MVSLPFDPTIGQPQLVGIENVNKIVCNDALCDIMWRTNYVMT